MTNAIIKAVKTLAAVGAFTGLTAATADANSKQPVSAKDAAQRAVMVDAIKKHKKQVGDNSPGVSGWKTYVQIAPDAVDNGVAVYRLTRAEEQRCRELAALSPQEYKKLWPAYLNSELDYTTSKCMTMFLTNAKGEMVYEQVDETPAPEYVEAEDSRQVRVGLTLGVIHVGEHTAPYGEISVEVARKLNERGTGLVMGAKVGSDLGDSNAKTKTWDSGTPGWQYQADYVLTEAQLAMVYAMVEQKAGPVTFALGGQFGYLHTREEMQNVKAVHENGDMVNYPDYKGEFERSGPAAGIVGRATLDLGEAMPEHPELQGWEVGAEASVNWMLDGEKDYEKNDKGGEPIYTLGARATKSFDFNGWLTGSKTDIPLK